MLVSIPFSQLNTLCISFDLQIHATQGVLNMKFAYQRKTRAAHIVGENLRLLILKYIDLL